MAAKTPPTPVEADENQSANTSPAARAPRKTSVPVVKESKLVPSNNIAEANDASIEMQGEPSLAEFIIETDNTLPAIEQGDHASAEQEAVHPRAVSAKIVYSVSDVSRFKRKPKPAPVDTARSALQRVIDVAYEIKNENTWLGDLRQMKDELLSRPGNGPSRDK